VRQSTSLAMAIRLLVVAAVTQFIAGCALGSAPTAALRSGSPVLSSNLSVNGGSQQWNVDLFVAGISRGPDNRIWFWASGTSTVEAIAADGTITHYPVSAFVLTIASRHTMWFVDGASAGILTTAGKVISQSPLPSGSCPSAITGGPDGNAWITDVCNNAILRLTPKGVVNSFRVPTPSSFPLGITVGSDGNLWFTENRGNIGRITTQGVITEFPTGDPLGFPTLAPDGNIYVPGGLTHLWSVTPQGTLTEYQDSKQRAYAQHIAVGPDKKALWLAISSGYVEKFDLVSHTFSPDIQVVNGGLDGITAGPDHDIWYGGWVVHNGDATGVIGVRN
jgi:virginiamycin B lyase